MPGNDSITPFNCTTCGEVQWKDWAPMSLTRTEGMRRVWAGQGNTWLMETHGSRQCDLWWFLPHYCHGL